MRSIPWSRTGRALLWLVFLLLPSGLLADGAAKEFTVELDGGDLLEVESLGEAEGTGPLFIWLIPAAEHLDAPRELLGELAEQGATVWVVDLLDSLLLERASSTVRGLEGKPAAALLEEAGAQGYAPVTLVASDRMGVPALRGLREWQAATDDPDAVAGAILLFPNLYRGTPAAGDDPELFGIVDATNMPVAVFQPADGAHAARLPELMRHLYAAGSPALARIIAGERDYYMRPDEAGSDAVERTPQQLLATARVLAGLPRPAQVAELDEERDQPLGSEHGMVERAPEEPPGYELTAARGETHRLEDRAGQVTLVNFWASWCPPCVHEIPSMNRLEGSYDEDEFAIVSINFRESPEHILEFMEEVEVDFPVLMDEDGAVSQEWGVFAFPSSFLLDREGRVRYSVNEAIEWDTDEVREVIDELRDEPAPNDTP